MVNQSNRDGCSPLFGACWTGKHALISLLLDAGADVDQATHRGCTPLGAACISGHLAIVQRLSSYGADRQVSPESTAEELATRLGDNDICAWLVSSRHWSTPLHHLDIISADRARALLRDGADLYATAAPGGPTPLSLAEDMRGAGTVDDGSAAQLVLDAAEPWSKSNLSSCSRGRRACWRLSCTGWGISYLGRSGSTGYA